MTSTCDGVLLLIGPSMVAVGLFALVLGIEAWRRPQSRFVQRVIVEGYPPRDKAAPISRLFGLTRERAGPVNLAVIRLLGPINGTVFVVLGCFLTVSTLRCAVLSITIPPLIGPLEFRYWPPMLAFIAFAALIGVANAWNARPRLRWISVLFTVLWAFGAAEAAAFHTGIQAQRWAFLVIGAPLLYTAAALLRRRLRTPRM